jgi:glycine cleavage system H protein
VSLPDDRRYSREHEWIRPEGAEAVIGLTQFAVTELGDIVYVELPAPGSAMTQFQSFGVVESVKAVSDLFAPLTGSVTSTNEALAGQPELVNSDPFGAGWMIKVNVADQAQLDDLLDGEAYDDLVAAG